MTIPFPARFRAVRRIRFASIMAGALLAPLTAGVAPLVHLLSFSKIMSGFQLFLRFVGLGV
ncbi:MAG: hypothetical protein KKF33_07610, partial [Alphaproteobacteria bacterium]|nr:hypothetical protein [Alphaproteobacteria bacterium]